MLELTLLLPLTLLGLVGFAAAASNDDDDSDTGLQPDPEPQPDPGVARPSGEPTPGDDVIYTIDRFYNMTSAGAGDDLVFGGTGPDMIWGEEGDDTLVGGAENDRLYDADGDNQLFGGSGDDDVFLGGGSTATGGEGEDEFGIRANLDRGKPAIITDFTQGEDELGPIYLTSSAEQPGDFFGRVWDDGTGIDLYLGDSLVASIAGGQDIDLSQIDVLMDLTGDQVKAGSGDDVIRADGAEQTIRGGAGDDRITQWGGEADGDHFLGGEGDDTLAAEGGAWADGNSARLSGGIGDDVLVGLGGNVAMSGGEGEDIFGVTIGQDNVTRINDFQPDEDVIYIGSEPGMEVDISVTPWADGTGASITVNGNVVAQVLGGQNLTAADIRVANLGLEVELLGYEG